MKDPLDVDDLPPSTKAVLLVLEHADEDSALTVTAIAKRSRLPDRTVRYALRQLRERDLVEVVIDYGDLRRRRYRLADRKH